MSGFIVHAFGFRSMLYFISFICVCYAPLMLFLRNPPAKDEKIVRKMISKIFFFSLCFLVTNHE